MSSGEWIKPIRPEFVEAHRQPGFIEAHFKLPPRKPALFNCAVEGAEDVRAEFTVTLTFDVLQRACLTHLLRTTNDSVEIIELPSPPPIDGLVQYVVRVSGIDRLGEFRLRKMGEQHTEIAFFTAVAKWPASTPAQSAAFSQSFLSFKTWEEANAIREQIRAERDQTYEQLCNRILRMQDVVFNGLIEKLNDDITAIVDRSKQQTQAPVVPQKPEASAPLERWFEYKEACAKAGTNYTHAKLAKECGYSHGYFRAEYARWKAGHDSSEPDKIPDTI